MEKLLDKQDILGTTTKMMPISFDDEKLPKVKAYYNMSWPKCTRSVPRHSRLGPTCISQSYSSSAIKSTPNYSARRSLGFYLRDWGAVVQDGP